MASTLAIRSMAAHGISTEPVEVEMPEKIARDHAIQWRMIQDAHELRAHSYDLGSQ